MNPAQLAQIRAKAQEGIARRMFNDAGNTDSQLRSLGTAIADKCGCLPVFGPIKDKERAGQKVANDYGGDWYDLKDAVRMTIVAPTGAQLRQVQATIRVMCVPSNGYSILKDFETTPATNACGFSGLNFVISLPGGRPGEIQANIPEVIYGQASEERFRKTIGAAKHGEIKTRFGIDGGIGHALYEVWRVAPTTPAALRAAAISRAYYDYLRGQPNRQACDALLAQLDAFERANPGSLHH